jgi:Fe-Mn family superoxide dismutase
MVENKLPGLGYAYDALEPYMDKETMMVHHDEHHQAYFDKYHAAIRDHAELRNKGVGEVLKNLDKVPEDIRTAVRNNGGGHYHHSFFWPILKRGVEPGGEVVDAIKREFGSMEKFREGFSNAAASVFGSGWTWLVVNEDGRLEIISTPNQDSPVSMGKRPVLGIDVWEHAYYLKYRNRRPEYIGAFFSVINWKKVNEHFMKARGE